MASTGGDAGALDGIFRAQRRRLSDGTEVYHGTGRGKATADSDIVRVRFVELKPDELIVEAATFESEAPANAGTMTLTTRVTSLSDGTKVTVTAENVPAGISEEDHRKGMESSLRNLALLLE